MSRKITFILVFISFFLGIILGQISLGNWKNLKEIDDRVINISSDAFSLCVEGSQAEKSFDLYRVNRVANDLNFKADELRDLGNQRGQILRKLGY